MNRHAWGLLALIIILIFPQVGQGGTLPYSTYLPVASVAPMRKGIGIADGNIHDVQAVGAEWWYSWGNGDLYDPRFVPMDFTGRQWFLPAGYAGWVMVFNEPENPEQSNLTASEAVVIYGEFIQRYPQARVILGNVGLWGPVWILNFQVLLEEAGLPRPAGWGLHGYVEPGITAEQVIAFWAWFRATIVRPGEQLWVTELATVYGLPGELGRLISWASQNADRYAVFTNRVDDSAWWYPANWPHPPRLALVDGGGLLTPLGEYYRLIK